MDSDTAEEGPLFIDDTYRPTDDSQKFYLNWNGFQGNLIRFIEGFGSSGGGYLSDVTLSCDEGPKYRLHKIVLASSSLYFQDVFKNSESENLTLILSGIRADLLELLVNFLYSGYIDVPVDKLEELVILGKYFKVKGLMDFDEKDASLKQSTTFMLSPLSETSPTPKASSSVFPDIGQQIKSQKSLPEKLPTIFENNDDTNSLLLLATVAEIATEKKEIKHETEKKKAFRHHVSGLTVPPLGTTSGNIFCRQSQPSKTVIRIEKENKENQSSVSVNSQPRIVIPSTSVTSRTEVSQIPQISIPDTNGSWQIHRIDQTIDLNTHSAQILVPKAISESFEFINPALDISKSHFGEDRAKKNPAFAKCNRLSSSDDDYNSYKSPLRKKKRKTVGATWKSRQPTTCDMCYRVFSNKFNLKQHVMNMHSVGGEINCEICDKLVKNKWYLRRHKVTHHGAPLKKFKKEPKLSSSLEN